MYKEYRRTNIAEMTPWTPNFDMAGVSISDADKKNGSPKQGDMIARNPKSHNDKWLVAAKYFKDNFEEIPECSITFYHIGGYELLRDGTKENGPFHSLKELQDFFDKYELDYDKSITDPIELAETVESQWENRYDDGGGSGWIEY